MDTMISVSKARRTLGSLAEDLTDNQVREIIQTLHLLARENLCYNGSKEGMSSHGTNHDAKT